MSELDPELAKVLRPRVERLNYLGEFFQCTGHQPQALISFYNLTENLKEALPDNLTELVALTIAARLDNAYERVQHESLALKLGFNETWIREVLSLKPTLQQHLSAQEIRVQQLAIAVVERHGKRTKAELREVVDVIGHAQTVAVLMLIGRYVMHSLIANCLELEPPVSSPLGLESS